MPELHTQWQDHLTSAQNISSRVGSMILHSWSSKLIKVVEHAAICMYEAVRSVSPIHFD